MKPTQSFIIAAVIGLRVTSASADAFLPGIPTVPFQSTTDGSYSLADIKGIVVDSRYADTADEAGLTLIPPTLFEFAWLFAEDLSNTIGVSVNATTGAHCDSAGSIFLTLGTPDEYVDTAGRWTSEGYTLVVTPSGITITGASPLGVWWGTRTVLQQGVLSLADAGVASVPYGSGVDVPGWPERGVMLDAGRHYYPPDFITDMCSYMSFFKQNTLHLHLSDNLYNNANYTTEQSLALYARFRLWSDASTLAGLNLHANESYDRPTFDAIQASCASRGVTVLPEIEAPGHALVVTQWKPQIGLATDLSLLNISHPETIPTMKSIWGTFLPWFHSKVVSIGADEYTGPPADYNTFVNAMDVFISTESGKSTRIWGTFPPICKSQSVQHWEYFEDNPYFDYIENNYSVINSNDDFYIVNKWAPPGGYLNTINLTKTFHGSPSHGYWRPNIFDQSNATDNPPASNPSVLGAIAPLWNDYGYNASVYSEAYYAWREGIPALADKQWGGNLSEVAFGAIFNLLHPKIPAQNLERTVPSQSAVIFNYTLADLGSAVANSVTDTSGNTYAAQTDCSGAHDSVGTPALSISAGCSLVTPLDSKGRNYTLTMSLLIDSLTNPTNATLLSGRDSVLMLTPNITMFAGGNYFRLNATVPQGTWFDLALIGRGNRTFAAVDGGPEMEFLAQMGINGVYFHWAEIAIEAPLAVLGGPNSGWSGLLGGMSLTSVA